MIHKCMQDEDLQEGKLAPVKSSSMQNAPGALMRWLGKRPQGSLLGRKNQNSPDIKWNPSVLTWLLGNIPTDGGVTRNIHCGIKMLSKHQSLTSCLRFIFMCPRSVKLRHCQYKLTVCLHECFRSVRETALRLQWVATAGVLSWPLQVNDRL